ncbi:hypothetical protein JL722_10969 [Aureococcus anophagefferens]|nr:hypothetical protein JL722_10969 [Aureococcus anophagefferens]
MSRNPARPPQGRRAFPRLASALARGRGRTLAPGRVRPSSRGPRSEYGFVERCGEFDRVVAAGASVVCWPFEVAGRVSLRIQQLGVACETKTSDNVFVNVVISVQYKATAGAAAARPRTARRAQVKTAMNEINASKRLKEAAFEKAEGEKVLLVKSAEAEAESKYLSGLGVARQRKAIVDGLRDSISQFSEGVQGSRPKDVIDLLLLTQNFDMLKDVGAQAGTRAVFLPKKGASQVGHVRDGLSDRGLRNRVSPPGARRPRSGRRARAAPRRGTRARPRAVCLRRGCAWLVSAT